MPVTVIPANPTSLTTGETKVLDRVVKLYGDTDAPVFIYVQPRIRNFEPDFIIMDPSRGVCVIEVKDWSADYVEVINKRVVKTKDGERPNPAFQANRYHDLIKGMLEADEQLYDDSGEPCLQVSTRLVFTKMTDEAVKPIYEQLPLCPSLLITSTGLSKLSLRTLFGEAASTMTAAQMLACRACLFPEIRIRTLAAEPTTNGVMQTVKALDAEQEQFARTLPFGHFMVSGVPGSGKTVILLARALHLCKEHPEWQILVVTYNKSLQKRLEARIKALSSELKFAGIPYANIHVATFHQVALQCSGMAVPQNAGDEFWSTTVVTAALARATPIYDAVLVDEYQDFHAGWFTLCLALARKHQVAEGETSEVLFLAGDRLQCIYKRAEFSWSHVGINISGGSGAGRHSHLLKHTYRTGRRHITLALDFLMQSDELRRDVEKFYEGREGIENVSDVRDEIAFLQGGHEAIIEHIRQLLAKGGYNPQDVLVLCPTHDVAESLFEAMPHHIKKVSKHSKDVDEETLVVTTYHSAKGLERKVVVLVNLDAVRDPRLVYVGMTRASDSLYIHNHSASSTGNYAMVQQLAGAL